MSDTGMILVGAFDPSDEYENGVRLVAPTGQVVCRSCFHRMEMLVTDDGLGRVWGVRDGGPTDLRPSPKQSDAPAHNWQPIASAPKDGTRVLIWSQGSGVETGYFWQGRYRGEWRAGGGSAAPRAPRYWQPLPPGPNGQ